MNEKYSTCKYAYIVAGQLTCSNLDNDLFEETVISDDECFVYEEDNE